MGVLTMFLLAVNTEKALISDNKLCSSQSSAAVRANKTLVMMKLAIVVNKFGVALNCLVTGAAAFAKITKIASFTIRAVVLSVELLTCRNYRVF